MKKISERLDEVSRKTHKLPNQVETLLFYPSVVGDIKKLIKQADESGNKTIVIEDVLEIMEKHAK